MALPLSCSCATALHHTAGWPDRYRRRSGRSRRAAGAAGRLCSNAARRLVCVCAAGVNAAHAGPAPLAATHSSPANMGASLPTPTAMPRQAALAAGPVYEVPSTGAKVTLENAQVRVWCVAACMPVCSWRKGATRPCPLAHLTPCCPSPVSLSACLLPGRQLLLHSYVSRLPADQYTTLRPLYRTGGACLGQAGSGEGSGRRAGGGVLGVRCGQRKQEPHGLEWWWWLISPSRVASALCSPVRGRPRGPRTDLCPMHSATQRSFQAAPSGC